MTESQTGTNETNLFVDLWAARLPWPAWFAEHCWLVIHRVQKIDRWEVWQSPERGGKSWGHLHRNLMSPTAGVGGNPAYHLARWTGDKAVSLTCRIENAPTDYPWCNTYHYVPGPNSNTFVQWCLQDQYILSWRSIGRGYAHSS